MGAVGVVHAAEIRVLGPSAIEDYHSHLMRIDRGSLFPGDDRAVDSHCLDLVASGAILIGAYVKGVMRAAANRSPRREKHETRDGKRLRAKRRARRQIFRDLEA